DRSVLHRAIICRACDAVVAERVGRLGQALAALAAVLDGALDAVVAELGLGLLDALARRAHAPDARAGVEGAAAPRRPGDALPCDAGPLAATAVIDRAVARGLAFDRRVGVGVAIGRRVALRLQIRRRIVEDEAAAGEEWDED